MSVSFGTACLLMAYFQWKAIC